jgi:antitoxin component of MazEF toxin-antitoxin module
MVSFKIIIVRTGNFQGVRIPKTLSERCHLKGE